MSQTVYVVCDEGYVRGVFSNREAANKTFPGEEIDEQEVFSEPLEPWVYWHRGAAVYPDGTFNEWSIPETARGKISIAACDDHLNSRNQRWDGHTQGHCGEHISIVGTDRDAVEAAFQKHLKTAISRQNGRCQSSWPHHTEADGSSTYEESWHKIRATKAKP